MTELSGNLFLLLLWFSVAASGFVILNSLRRAATNQLLQEFDGDVNLLLGHTEARREREDVLVVAADVEDESHPATARVEVAAHPFGEHLVGKLSVRLVSVLAANLDAQSHPAPVRVAYDFRVAALKLAYLREEVCPFAPRYL